MTTNGTGNGLPPNINDMWNAISQLKATLAIPPKEFKLHPDDYKELQRQAKPFLKYPCPEVPDSFGGLKIIVDEAAERLPRKPRLNE